MNNKKTRLSELETGIKKFSSRIEYLEKRSRSFGLYRLGVFLTGLTLFLLSFFFLAQIYVYISLIITLISFGILTSFHNKVDNEIKKCRIWLNIKKDNLARMNINWDNIPLKASETNKSHPFESDLSITGRNSLHQLIDISVSDEGSNKLKEWLLTINPVKETILERQQIIKELIPLQRFRNKLILNSNLASKKRLEGTKLSTWLKSESEVKRLKNILSILSLLIPLNVLLFILFLFNLIPAYWSFGILIYLGLHWFNIKYISESFEKYSDIQSEFGKFSVILEFLEKYNYAANKILKSICSIYFESRKSPSVYFKKLNRITTAVSLQKNDIMMILLNILFPYSFFFAYKMEKLKLELKDKLPVWLETYYNLEALVSLSNFAYLNPDYVFPSMNDNENTLLEVENISHPFIPDSNSVSNNFVITKDKSVVIITGSNMSGKSTFLKSVGINLALTFAGSVVCASKFNTELFRIYTCISISDSVTDGISYFYAEVKRLKILLNEIKKENELPVFFLIDEIFRGTNNLERLIGSRSYIKSLAGLNGTGLVSTHDLELVNLEKDIPAVVNYHFKEDVSGGKMIFDYKLRNGPSPTTNALKIMEIEGLPVER